MPTLVHTTYLASPRDVDHGLAQLVGRQPLTLGPHGKLLLVGWLLLVPSSRDLEIRPPSCPHGKLLLAELLLQPLCWLKARRAPCGLLHSEFLLAGLLQTLLLGD